jgi:hypothetical protein
MTMNHEYVHQVIFDSYNIDSRVEYLWEEIYNPIKWFDNNDVIGVTYPEESCPTELCEIQHNLLEVVQYIMNILLAVILTISIFIIMLRRENEDS